MKNNRFFLLLSCLNVLGLFYYLIFKSVINYLEFLLLQFVSFVICVFLVKLVDKNTKPKVSSEDKALFGFRCLFSEGGEKWRQQY